MNILTQKQGRGFEKKHASIQKQGRGFNKIHTCTLIEKQGRGLVKNTYFNPEARQWFSKECILQSRNKAGYLEKNTYFNPEARHWFSKECILQSRSKERV